MKKKLRIIFIFLLFVLFNLNTIKAADYYLSNTGDDNNAGTSPETAWKTIAKLNSQMAIFTPGTRILFKRGDVFTGQINFTMNGDATDKFIFDAYGTGEKPVISAAVPAENWVQHSGNIWKTTISQGNVMQIFSNGIRLPNARFPNEGFLVMDQVQLNKAEFKDNDPLVAGKPENFFKGAKVVFKPRDWYWAFPTVNSSSSDGVITYSTSYTNLVGGLGYFFTDKIEFLDSENEWYFDNSTNTLYFYSNANPTDKNILAAVFDYGIICPYDSKYITIQNLCFKYQNKDGVALKGANSLNNTVSYCDFTGQIKSGISVGGRMINVENNRLEDICGRGINIDGMRNSTIKLNEIRRIGLVPGMGNSEVHDMVGIKAWSSDSLLIQENIVDSTGYNGLSFLSGHLTIKWNKVSNSLLKCSDGAGIYVYDKVSFENIFLNNFVENIVGNIEARPADTKKLACGIYIDNNAYNCYIYSNTVKNIDGNGILINANVNNVQVYRNIVYNCNVSFKLSDYLAGKTVFDIVSAQNVFYASKNGSIPVEIESNDNNYDVFSSSDNNYLCNPLWDKVVMFSMYRSETFNMNEWRSATGLDLHSYTSYYTWTAENNRSFLLSNKTNTAKEYTFEPNTVFDLKNNPVTKLTLKAYSSEVLISSMIVNSPGDVVKNLKQFTIFPIPAANSIFIKNDFNSSAYYRIVNLNGQAFSSGKIDNSFTELNIEHLKKGTYVIILYDIQNNPIQFEKIIKQ